jgi:hypothetical protein
MGKLKPIGSEKLQGMDKINRILEIARYKESTPNPINEDMSIDYSKTLSDGNKYHIVKEKNGYVIKKSLTESVDMDYLEPMKNRKYYSSYSQAFKRLNLIAKEVNLNEGYEGNINLFEGEVDEKASTKYILKFGDKGETKEQDTVPSPVSAPAPAPAPAPSPEVPAEEPLPEPEPEMDVDSEIDVDMNDEGDDDVVTYKVIQKLTGKLAQKIRTLNDDEEQQMSSKDIKYVINSILSALKLDNLEEEDMEDIVSKLEGSEEEPNMDGGDEDVIDVDMEVEEPMEPSPEGEMAEDKNAEEFVDNLFKGVDEDMNVDNHENKLTDMIEGMFTESKVDSVLKKYFTITEGEKKQIIAKKQQIVEHKKKTLNKIKVVSETLSQEIMGKKLVSKYPNAKLLGKTKNKNLVFEVNNKQIKISKNGQIL